MAHKHAWHSIEQQLDTFSESETNQVLDRIPICEDRANPEGGLKERSSFAIGWKFFAVGATKKLVPQMDEKMMNKQFGYGSSDRWLQ